MKCNCEQWEFMCSGCMSATNKKPKLNEYWLIGKPYSVNDMLTTLGLSGLKLLESVISIVTLTFATIDLVSYVQDLSRFVEKDRK